VTVYIITCLANGRYYVGQTVQKSLRTYLLMKRSKAKKRTDRCNHLYRALRKYPIENFVIEPLVECTCATEMNGYEMLWIAALNSRDKKFGMNIVAGGDSSWTGIKRNFPPSWYANISRAHVGILHTGETKEKIRQAHLGKHHSVAGIENITKAQRKRRQQELLEKTQCRRGHEYVEGSWYWSHDTWRVCRLCRRDKSREWRRTHPFYHRRYYMKREGA